MLNISSTTAVSWPTPVSAAVAPVSPVAPVQPVQAGSSDGKAQMGFGRDGRAAPQPAAPRRPDADGRNAATDGTAAAPGETSAAALQEQAAQRKMRQEAVQAAEKEQAKDKKAVEHLQNVLSRMWEASAAVVDRALGIEPARAGDVPGNQSDTAPDLSAVAASTLPRKPLPAPGSEADKPAQAALAWPVMPEPDETALDVVGDGVAADGTVAEVVAYDEQGNGSPAPVEVGSLISERV